MYKLGIDVGGTNTDAVLIDHNLNIVAGCKVATSKDVYTGILSALDMVLKESNIDKSEIRQAILGTTQCTNAIVERKHLAKVGVIRIGAPAAVGIPPMVDWKEDIQAVAYKVIHIGGGFEYDGKPLAPLDTKALTMFLQSVKGKVDAIAISCVFSSIRNDHELEAAKICKEILGEDIHISISSEIGSMGLIERENATILNASLCYVVKQFTDGFVNSLAKKGIQNASVYLSQNDGTVMTMEYAKKYPILTIACGPTNSIRGASYLSHLQDAIVIDVGGTTTDLGVISHGFPRESSVAATVGDVRTNFRMPDITSIGLGGGSIVRQHSDGHITVGPDSVGYDITSKALIFGGDVMTATDIAVRLGMADIDDSKKVAHISKEFANEAMKVMVAMVEDSIDMMKLSSDNVDVILVGGGSILLPSKFKGAKTVTKPTHAGIANAIGSAISKVSGVVECLVNYDEKSREQAIEESKQQAIQEASRLGAIIDSIEIIEVEDVPLAYYPGNTNRIKVKASGDLGINHEYIDKE